MSGFVYNRHVMSRAALKKRLLPIAIGLATGAFVLPALIYGCGLLLLGSYDGGSLPKTYQVVLGGLAHGSIPSWVVLLGPYMLWQLARLLRSWWHAGARAFR
jgi:hypothetical protein